MVEDRVVRHGNPRIDAFVRGDRQPASGGAELAVLSLQRNSACAARAWKGMAAS